ncbi:hypothetical protein PC129_g2807 [Phytophthora cactorum]|uniref:Uncharacterized protein n=1 Tax=Phytophthora cactorum TaxID=29920 RepID=A0A8T1IUQ2_9STRA|nr:hypothetical protein PC114_g6283 [Phytophthora cactorum]KAG3192558.1 hypothetical protein PC128_g10504 [Phytophthora cactorum]KAG3226622.1 hypothetical protein PC129_g2807 [Phytophthora cactorum]KAG4057217.1 hypothetical protein PC123_g7765 [Phytophthora cactorum]
MVIDNQCEDGDEQGEQEQQESDDNDEEVEKPTTLGSSFDAGALTQKLQELRRLERDLDLVVGSLKRIRSMNGELLLWKRRALEREMEGLVELEDLTKDCENLSHRVKMNRRQLEQLKASKN